jgi:BASS family bile acid:Na+ symporter
VDLHDSLKVLDEIRLNFSKEGLFLLNITLAFIMFGVALELKMERFKRAFIKPKALITGLFTYFIFLPALTLALIFLINPSPSVALGMILVAACPGGNVSNFMTSLARGNTELSVTLTAISDISAVIITPLNFTLWGSIYANIYSSASNLVIPIQIDPVEMFETLIVILLIPLIIGMLFARKFPKITQKITKPLKYISILIFFGYIVAALAANFSFFLKYIHLIGLIVIIHNTLAFTLGFSVAKIVNLNKRNIRTVTIETGIHNTGLGLVLIFNPHLFNGLGGMAFIAAWWGIWHIISGLSIATFWSYRPIYKTSADME